MTNPRGVRIGVVGATGQVGAVVRRLLDERDFPIAEIRFFASARSAGTTIDFKGSPITVEDASRPEACGVRDDPTGSNPSLPAWQRSLPARSDMGTGQCPRRPLDSDN